MMMDTCTAPRQGGEAAAIPVTAPGRAAPATPDTAVARAKLQPTVYVATRSPDG